jgi:hypothetical protein
MIFPRRRERAGVQIRFGRLVWLFSIVIWYHAGNGKWLLQSPDLRPPLIEASFDPIQDIRRD